MKRWMSWLGAIAALTIMWVIAILVAIDALFSKGRVGDAYIAGMVTMLVTWMTVMAVEELRKEH